MPRTQIKTCAAKCHFYPCHERTCVLVPINQVLVPCLLLLTWQQAELTAGVYNTGSRNGYLAFCQVLARHGVALVLTGGEMRDCEQPSYALASPEALLLQLRATAASQQVPVTLSNLSIRFDGEALGELERKAFDSSCYRGIDLGHVDALVFNSMNDAMFEPQINWLGFKDWLSRVKEHNAALAAERQLRSRKANAVMAARAAAAANKQSQETAAMAPATEQQERQSATAMV